MRGFKSNRISLNRGAIYTRNSFANKNGRFNRAYSTLTETPKETVWSRMKESSGLLKPALFLLILGSVATNYNREKKSFEEIRIKYERKIQILTSIRERLGNGEKVDLKQELKLINKSFEFLGLNGSYFKGHVERAPEYEMDHDIGAIFKELESQPMSTGDLTSDKRILPIERVENKSDLPVETSSSVPLKSSTSDDQVEKSNKNLKTFL